MIFSNYIWHLYKKSDDGIKMIREFNERNKLKSELESIDFNMLFDLDGQPDSYHFLNAIIEYFSNQKFKDIDEAVKKYEEAVIIGIPVQLKKQELTLNEDPSVWFEI